MTSDARQHADYVRLDLAALRRGVHARRKPEAIAGSYEDGWNDALYLILDILDGAEPYQPRTGA